MDEHSAVLLRERTRPWLDFTWTELHETAARFSADPSVRRWLAELSTWAAELRALTPLLAATAQSMAGKLSTDQIRSHPAAAVLFQARNGRLNLDRQCSTPGRTIALAAALDLATPAMPT
jgi:serine/threonine protein phosphatase 1